MQQKIIETLVSLASFNPPILLPNIYFFPYEMRHLGAVLRSDSKYVLYIGLINVFLALSM